jgi:peptide/nickel transport system substrate-binding protein
MRCTHKTSARFAALLALSLLPVWQAGVAATPPPAPVAQPLRIAVGYAPKSLDPALATDAAGARLLQLTNPALMQWGPGYVPTGLVASGCKEAGLTITCMLPKGRTFHDGTPLTAQQVAGWFTFLKNTPQSALGGALAPVKEIAAKDAQTLTLTLAAPKVGALGMLTEIPLAPSPTTTALGVHRAGVGPYKLVAEDELGNVELAYAQAANPQKVPARMQFVYVQDPTTRLLKLKKGEVDAVFGDVPPELAKWSTAQGWQVVASPSSSYSYLALNFGNEFVAVPEIREALERAIDREAIRKHLLGGFAVPADSLLPPGHPAAWAAPEAGRLGTFEMDELLDDAGTLGDENSPRFNLTLLTSTDPLSQRVSQVIQQQVRKAGIQLDLRPMEWGAFYDAVKQGRFDIALMSWTGEQQPEFLYKVFHSSQVPPVGLNRGRVKVAELDAATQKIASATTVAVQHDAAIAAQQVQAKVRPYIPLYRRSNVVIMRPGVGGCTVPLAGGYQGLLACKVK